MKQIMLKILFVLALVLAITARPITSGIAWDFGGFDRGGLFVCPGSYDAQTDTLYANPLAPLFPELVTDC
jgi:hypothetical protein